jgi:predicted transcriptional regulator
MTLREWLTENKISIGKFGEMIGVSESCVYHYTTFNRVPSLAMACKIHDVTKKKVKPWDLLPPEKEEQQELEI